LFSGSKKSYHPRWGTIGFGYVKGETNQLRKAAFRQAIKVCQIFDDQNTVFQKNVVHRIIGRSFALVGGREGWGGRRRFSRGQKRIDNLPVAWLQLNIIMADPVNDDGFNRPSPHLG
jgi:hypothetical protein